MDPITPQLVRRLRSLPRDVRRSILLRACCFAADKSGVSHGDTMDFLSTIRTQGGLSPEQALKATRLAQELDHRSFELEEQDAPREAWLPPFSEARILTAIAAGFGPDCEDDAAAFYELLKSLDHGAGLEEFLQQAMGVPGG